MQGQLVPILVVFIVVGLPIICATLVSLAKILRGRDSRSGGNKRGSEHDESKLIQEIHRGLSRMEDRIEALETIVINSETKKPTSPPAP